MSTEPIFQAQNAVEKELLDKPNVVGVGVGYKISEGKLTDEVAIIALVEEKKPPAILSALELIPRIIAGFRTDVYEVGELRAQQTSPRERYRPVPVGVSVGHFKVTAGTLGAVVVDRITGEKFILSNNHVLANCNDGLLGDAILQPAGMDSGRNPEDLIAILSRYVPLRYVEDAGKPALPPLISEPSRPTTPGGGYTPPPSSNQGCDVAGFFKMLNDLLTGLNQPRAQSAPMSAQTVASSGVAPGTTYTATTTTPENFVDCALGRPIDPSLFSNDVRYVGKVSGTKPVMLGMRVRKVGRTSDYTEGSVTVVNSTVNVSYNTAAGKKTARFTGQVLTTPMSQGGDSGSLIIDAQEPRAVGLLFGGSTSATLFTPIEVVLNALGVNLV